jgi:hypothetical protein
VLPDLELLKRRYKKARSKADLWISLLEACYHYTVPSRNLYYWTSQYQGSQKNARVWDTTAVAGVRNFVSKIHNGLCPPGQQWYSLEAGPDVDKDARDEVNEKLQHITDQIYFYLKKSNFDLAVNEAFYDLAIGTAALICNPGPSPEEPLEFYSTPLARIAIEETACNKLETVFRWWDEIRIADIQQMWPQATLPQSIQALFDEDENATLKQLIEATVYDPASKLYRYVVFYDDGIFVDEIRDETPWIIFRWSKVSNEIYGRGPVIEALPSILTLNEMIRIEYAAANFNIAKPYMAYSDGVFNPYTFRLEPNTVIPVAPNSNGQWPIQPFPDNLNPQFLQITSLDLRTQINTLLLGDPLTPVQGPTRTATELALRQRNRLEEIGPTFTRLDQEFLSKVMKRVIRLLQKQGLIEDFVIDGQKIQLSYSSPLSQQQGHKNVENFLEYVQVLQAIQGPEGANINFNQPLLPNWIKEQMGIDPRLVNNEEQLKEEYGRQAQNLEDERQAQLPPSGGNFEPQQSLPSANVPGPV